MDKRADRGEFYPGGREGGVPPGTDTDKVDRVNVGEVGESYTLKDVKNKVNQIVRVIAPAAVCLALAVVRLLSYAATAPLEDIPNTAPVVTNEEDAVAMAAVGALGAAVSNRVEAAEGSLQAEIAGATNAVVQAALRAAEAESNRVESTYAKRNEIPAAPDLAPYALKSELPQDYLTENDITNFATRAWMNAQGYATDAGVSARIDAQDLAIGAATNALWAAHLAERARLDAATNAIERAWRSGTNEVMRAVREIEIVAADSNAVTRLVTPDGTTWQDATGTVWRATLSAWGRAWVDEATGNVFTNGVSVYPSEMVPGDMKGYLVYDPAAMEYMGGEGEGWYYNGTDTHSTPSAVLPGGSDATVLAGGRFRLAPSTNVVNRVAYTNDIARVISTNNPAFVAAVLAVPLEGAEPNDLSELAEYGGYGTVGAAIVALIAGLAALKRRMGAAEEAIEGKVSASELPYALVTPGEWEFSGVPSGWSVTDLIFSDTEWTLYLDNGESEIPYFEYGDGTELTLTFNVSVGGGGIITATRASLPDHLADRAGNVVEVTGTKTLTLPELVRGRLRDFYLKMTVTGSRQVSFSPSSGVAYTGYGNPARTYPAGTYVLHFTETSENEFRVADMLAKYAASGHEHSAANITSGKLAAARLPVATNLEVGAVKPDGTTVTVDADGVISAGGGGHVVKIQMDKSDYGSIVVNGSFTLDNNDLRSYAHKTGSEALLVLSDVTKIRINRGNNYTSCTIPLNTDVAVNADMAIVVTWYPDCLSPDTEIRMADGTLKKVADVVAGDVVATPYGPDAVVSASTGRGGRRDTWRFDDGSYVVTVGRHRFWNCELGEPMYLEAWNAGEHALTADGRRVALVSRETESGEFAHATIFTERYNLYYAGGLLAGNRRSVKGEV